MINSLPVGADNLQPPGPDACLPADLERRFCEELAQQKVELADLARARRPSAGNREQLSDDRLGIRSRAEGQELDAGFFRGPAQADECGINSVHGGP